MPMLVVRRGPAGEAGWQAGTLSAAMACIQSFGKGACPWPSDGLGTICASQAGGGGGAGGAGGRAGRDWRWELG